MVFRTWYRYYEYYIILFGLSNTLVIFQIYINKVLVGLIDIICIIYLDDIFIYFKNKSKYTEVVIEIL
jgi:hypothetical protein